MEDSSIFPKMLEHLDEYRYEAKFWEQYYEVQNDSCKIWGGNWLFLAASGENVSSS